MSQSTDYPVTGVFESDKGSTSPLEEVLDFMREHAEIVLALNPYNMHQLDTLSQSRPIGCNCCFWIPPLICDILQLQAPECGKKLLTSDGRPCYYSMRPGHYYYLECFNHHLSILYTTSGDIWYIDYYNETGRDAVFRVEKITLKELNRFVRAVTEGDIRAYSRFHKGNKDFKKSLRSVSKYIKPGSLVEAIYEQELSVEKEWLGLSELKRVIDETAPSILINDFDECDREFYVEDDFHERPTEELEKAKRLREAYITVFQLLLSDK